MAIFSNVTVGEEVITAANWLADRGLVDRGLADGGPADGGFADGGPADGGLAVTGLVPAGKTAHLFLRHRFGCLYQCRCRSCRHGGRHGKQQQHGALKHHRPQRALMIHPFPLIVSLVGKDLYKRKPFFSSIFLTQNLQFFSRLFSG